MSAIDVQCVLGGHFLKAQQKGQRAIDEPVSQPVR